MTLSTVAADGDLDATFGAGLSGANNRVRAVAAQADGKLLVGGDFWEINGTSRQSMARLNGDGTLDPTFNAGVNGPVYAIAAQTDGKVLIGGQIFSVNGTSRPNLARLNADGSVDMTFDHWSFGTNRQVRAITLQSDGKVLIGGDFYQVNGTAISRVARLNGDGTLDSTFTSGLDWFGANEIYALAVQSDGKILIGGDFITYGGTAANRIARLNGDGSLDTTFGAGLAGASDIVTAIAVQSDGKILIGGWFMSINGVARHRIARLNSDGSTDTDFGTDADGANGWVRDIRLQANGKALIGGDFIVVNGTGRGRIARLNTDGTPDTTFGSGVAGAGSSVDSLVVQDDGKVVIVGDFTTVNSTGKGRIARLVTSSNATLVSLGLSAGVLTPSFAPATTSYTAGVLNATASVLVTPVTADAGATVTVNGTTPATPVSLAVGNNPVTVLVTAPDGTTTRSYTVTVHRNALPELTLPGSPLLEEATGPGGAVVSFSATASDAEDGALAAAASPTSGGTFPLGDTTVNVSATDAAGEMVSGSFIVRVRDTTAPVVDAHGDMTVEATFPGGAWVGFTTTATDLVDGPVATIDTPASFSSFPLGTTPVSINATDAAGNVGTGSFSVTVEDTTAPVLTLPGDLTADATGPGGAAVTFAVGTTDAADPAPSLSVTPPSGSVFPAGTTTVNVSSTDASGNAQAGSFTVTVVVPPAPVIVNHPANRTAVAGDRAVLTVVAYGTGLTYQWLKDGVPLGGATGYGLDLTSVSAADTGSYTVVVTDLIMRSVTSGAATLVVNPARDGDVDFSFAGSSHVNGRVTASAVQSDGKILIGGEFTLANGAVRGGLARLHADGSADHTFAKVQVATFGTPNIYAIAVQSDGRILIGGSFTSVNGSPRGSIARLHRDGSLDTSFGTGMAGAVGVLGYTVSSIAVLPDGKLLIGGSFKSVNGVARGGIARLHADGTLDPTFGAGMTGVDAYFSAVLAFAVQPDGGILVGGMFSTFNGISRSCVARLNGDGTLDPTFGAGLAGVSGGDSWAVWSLALQSDGKVLIGGRFTTVNGVGRGCLARLHADGSLDTAFANGESGANTNATVQALAVQADGKVLLGGSFTVVNGVTRNRIARLNADGTLDGAYGAGLSGSDNYVNTLSLQDDGKLIACGDFATLNGSYSRHVARLNTDGTVDTAFGHSSGPDSWVMVTADGGGGKTLIGGHFTSVSGVKRGSLARLNGDGTLDSSFGNGLAGADGDVSAIVRQADGKVLVGGYFTKMNGTTRSTIARVNADGTLDSGFVAGTITSGYGFGVINTMAVQPDGKILIGGFFESVGGIPRGRIARLNGDGTLDPTFGGGLAGANSYVYAIAVQPDGKVLIGGDFNEINGTPRGRLARLNSDGSLDGSFGGAGTDQKIYGLTLQADGKVLIGGDFGTVNGTARGGIARVNSDGTLDPGFGSGLSGIDGYSEFANAIAVQTDGKVVVGGLFTTINGVPRGGLARLHSDGSLDSSFGDGMAGTDPWVTSMFLQGDGKAVIGGYFTTVNGTSRSCVSRVLSATHPDPVTIVCQPRGSATVAGDYGVLSVGATGSGLAYQWFKDGVPVPGANSSSWIIHPVAVSDAGTYTVTVSNLVSGTVTSDAAVLAVRPIRDGDLDFTYGGTPLGDHFQTLAVQPDGKVLIGGSFSRLNGAVRYGIARLNQDGSTDLTFGHDMSGLYRWGEGGATVFAMAVQPDGRILIAGNFSWVNGAFKGRIARLLCDGSLDPTFEPTTIDRYIYSLAVQPDGRILIGGSFSWVGDGPCNGIARLNADGSHDPTFGSGMDGISPFGYVRKLARQADGKVLICGIFSTVNGVARNGLARLNSDGTLDPAFTTTTNDGTHSLAVQSDGKILIGGAFTTVNGTARGRIARLHGDGTLDTTFGDALAGADSTVAAITVMNDGTVVIGGEFTTVNGTARGRVARLLGDGALDPTFGSGMAGANQVVSILAADSGGKMLVGGGFQSINGISRLTVARLLGDGSLDPGFDNGQPGTNNWVDAIVLQPDGKALMGGSFTVMNGTPMNRVARLNPDGSLDPAFASGVAGPNDRVRAIAVQSDGKVLIGGDFYVVHGVSRYRIARLNGDGTLDTTFASGLVGANGAVKTLALQSDGKVLIGGEFTMVNGVPRGCVARLNSDGTLDTTFGNGLAGADGYVQTLAVCGDGKVMIGGGFGTVNGTARGGIARLNADGSLDATFGSGMAGAITFTLALQSDGKVLIGGAFTTVNGIARVRLARLNSDGSVDSGFGDGLSGVGGAFYPSVNSLVIQSSGKILVGGSYGAVNDIDRGGIARLHSDGTLDTTFGHELAGADSVVNTVAVQANGKILIGGSFGSVNGVPRSYFARLEAGLANPDLDDLLVSTGTLSPVFASATTSYTVGVSNAVGSIVVTPVAADPALTATVNGGSPATPVTLAVGDNPITVLATAPDGITTKTYTVTVHRNALPTFSGLAIKVIKDKPATLTVARILGHAADPDGPAPALTAVAPATAHGGTAVLGAGSVVYTPPSGYTGPDTIGITLTDSWGDTITATITAMVFTDPAAGGSTATIELLPGGDVGLHFRGFPGCPYDIQRSTDLITWTTLATVTAAPDGTFPFIDADPPPGKAFYRAAIEMP